MSLVLEHARKHYFKGAYALSLFGDLSAIGGVPTYDAYGIQVPKPDTMLFPFTLNNEQEEVLAHSLPQLRKNLTLEEGEGEGERQLKVTSSGFFRKREHITLSSGGEKLKLRLLSDKDEPFLDTLLRETILGEALTQYWVSIGFFKRRELEDFEKGLVVEAALEEHVNGGSERRVRVTAEDATRELEKAHKLLLEITPKALVRQTVKSSPFSRADRHS